LSKGFFGGFPTINKAKLIQIPQKGDLVMLKNTTNPHVPTSAKLLVLSVDAYKEILTCAYHGSGYFVHIDNVKRIIGKGNPKIKVLLI